MFDRRQMLDRVRLIPGWLDEPAALFSLHMIDILNQRNIRGPMLEIGTYKGKFLALLRAASDHKVIGIELCPHGHAEYAVKEIVENVIAAAGHADGVEIVVANSCTLSSTDLLRLLGGQAIFIHIDGGHDVETVLHDLSISAPVLAAGGVIALDDAFNFGTPGVTEAICEFLSRNPNAFAPFAHCYNKLFAARPEHHADYLTEAKRFLEVAPVGVADRTKARMAENQSANFVPSFFGREILPFL